MERRVTLIGFGEAAMAFAPSLVANATVFAYDRKTDDPAAALAKRTDYARFAVRGHDDAARALCGAEAAFSLVTADQALPAAESAAPLLAAGAFWFDMNSVAPDTKRAAARVIEASGGYYVDVAVMAPVHPAAHAVPLFVSGRHAEPAAALLRALSFAEVRVVPGDVGRASSIKMVRSVMVKGVEALTAECVLAAQAAGVLNEVLASLDANPPPPAWDRRADYNLDRMMIHGRRRAAEMEEVVRTLDALGTGSTMSRGTASRQRAIGDLALAVPDGLDRKLDLLLARRDQAA